MRSLGEGWFLEFGLVVGLLAPVGCQSLSPKEEREFGAEQSHRFVQAYGGEIPSPVLRAYVRDVGQRLVENSTATDVTWSFQALDSESVSHFSLPGGYVYVTRGLLEELQNEAQLAAILAHEIAHVEKRHLAKRIEAELEKEEWVEGTMDALDVFDFFDSPSSADAINRQLGLSEDEFSVEFNSEEEREAVLRSLALLNASGYRVTAVLSVSDTLFTTAGVADDEALANHGMSDAIRDGIKAEIKAKYDPSQGENLRGPYHENVIAVLEA